MKLNIIYVFLNLLTHEKIMLLLFWMQHYVYDLWLH